MPYVPYVTEGNYLSDIVKEMLSQNFCCEKHSVLAGQSLVPGSICQSDSSGYKKQVVAGVDDVQVLTLADGTDGGTFRIAYSDDVTDALAYNVSAANMQTALRALHTDLASCTVDLTSAVYTITNPTTTTEILRVVNDCTADGGADEGGIVVTRTTVGVDNGGAADSICLETKAATNEVQTLTFTGQATAGTYTLTFTKYDGTTVTTGDIAYDAITSAIATAINAVLGTSAVAVSGTTPDSGAAASLTLTFSGANYTGVNQDVVTATISSLTGVTAATGARSTAGKDGSAVFLVRGPAIVDKAKLGYNSCTAANVNAALAALNIVGVTSPTATTLNS